MMYKSSSFCYLVLTLCLTELASADRHHPHLEYDYHKAEDYKDQNETYWKTKAEEELRHTLENLNSINTNVAKNVIIFIGDGMSLPTLTASRIYKAQVEMKVNDAEGSLLTFETFPHVGLSKTYSMNRQTPDSASTASAIYTGVKTNYYTMGFDNSIILGNSSSQNTAQKVETVMQWAQNEGKSTGFVTSARVSHATPAALYAHVANRNWECDRKMKEDGQDDTVDGDITLQLVTKEPGRSVDVVLGGGLNSFCPENASLAIHPACKYIEPPPEDLQFDYGDHEYFNCTRLDNKDLVNEFLKLSPNSLYVSNRSELLTINSEKVDKLLGLFSGSYLDYEDSRRKKDTHDEPSLAEMTTKAIEILKKNQNGFFLMVEGSNIDHSHHNSRASQALLETVSLDYAVEAALNLTDIKDTLILVTADHGHTMSMSGYQTRGADIRGLVDNANGTDEKPFMILNYANGDGFDMHLQGGDANDGGGNNAVIRADLNEWGENNYTDFAFKNPSAVPRGSETHSGSDVGIFAIGPYSHLFQSVHEQNYIAYVMSYSACMGPYKDDIHCSTNAASPGFTSSAKYVITSIMVSIIATMLLKNQ